jgi:hypothetical protein
MEIRFGADFSGIRIHTDDPAIQMTRLLNATAFTQGRDIYFNDERFAPGTREGDHLLAHELTHTIQQGAAGARPRAPRPEPGAVQRQEDRQGTILVRPELLQAIRTARGEIGKVNAKKTNADGTRLGWERLREYFLTAFGQKEVVHQDLIKFIRKVKDQQGKDKDLMPSWCGIFVWWAYKSAGIPIPDWKLGASILGWVVPRKPGELPRKGDIAYRELNQHFAMVTGVEDPASAAGKDFKNVRVATINGNTSGEDNLGGQVEEKWEPISRWLAFFDPVAKLDMPPAALVETGVAPDAAEAAETRAEAEAAAPTAAPVEDTAPTDVSDLHEAVTSEEEDPAEADASIPIDMPEPASVAPEGEVELPPAPAVPAPEPVAVVEPLPLDGPSDQAMVSFVDASPSQMAATAPGLAPAVDDKLHQEQKTEVESAPVLVAKTTGKAADAGLTPADQIPVPADTSIGEGGPAPGPEDLEAIPHENVGEPPGNEVIEEEMEDQDEGGFFGWLRRMFPSLLGRIRTTDPGVNTSAGRRPNVDLSEDASPNRMRKDRADARADLVAQRDRTAEAFRGHGGQQQIQPVAVEEEKPTALSPEVVVKPEVPPAQGVTDYAEARLPAEVRDRADELLGPKLDADLAPARTQTEEAAAERDTDKATEIANAEAETARINRDADKDQRDIVVKSRGEVARQQAEGIGDAYGQVNDFNKAADTKQTDARRDIGTKVTESEGDARRQMDDVEEQARKKKADTEKEAADKKRELEKAEEDDSWWDRAVSVVKSAVRAISNAIKSAFNKLRAWVKDVIDRVKKAVVDLINRARNWIVNKLNDFRDWAKEQVTKYLGDTFPGLARRINAAIDTAVDGAIDGVNFVADTAIAAVEKLANALAKALDKILQVFQTALTAAVGIAGAIITGDFAEALRIAIQAVCDIVGIDSQPIFDFIDRAASMLITILKDPGTFFNNLMSAVGGGVRSFAKNIKEHLINGLLGWLTGALSEVAIKLPETFDFKGMFSLVAQILGLSYENIKAKVIKRFPPAATVFGVIEKRFAIVARLVTEGPGALWEEAQQALSNLKEIVLRGIRTYVITTVVKEAIVWLLSLLNPAAALAKLIKLIFDLVMFLIERFEQIKDFVLSVYDSLAAIASGALEQATKAVEDALARSLPVVISLLATLAGLSGIGKTVKSIISTVSTPVHRVVDRIVAKIVAFAKKLLKKGKAAAKKVKEVVAKLFFPKRTFQAGGESHTLSFRTVGTSQRLFISTVATPIEEFLDHVETEQADALSPEQEKAVKDARGIVKNKIVPLTRRIEDTNKKAPKQVPALMKDMLDHEVALSATISVILGTSQPLAVAHAKYKLEGLTGTFASQPQAKADDFTPDHQPQAAILQYAASQPYFADEPAGQKMVARAADRASLGYTIFVHKFRHKEGRTYFGKGSATKAAFVERVEKAVPPLRTSAAKRKKVVEMMIDDLAEDATKMKAVAGRSATDPVWQDINALPIPAKEKKDLITKSGQQIVRGENLLLAQNLDTLAK